MLQAYKRREREKRERDEREVGGDNQNGRLDRDVQDDHYCVQQRTFHLGLRGSDG